MYVHRGSVQDAETDAALPDGSARVVDMLRARAPCAQRRFSNIYRQVPKLGFIIHPLPLSKALAEYDEFCALTNPRYVRPNFAEVRHAGVINIAQATRAPRR